PPAGPAPDVWRGAFTVQQRSVATPDKDGVQEVTLTRATYRLPKEKAEALAGLLRQHVKVALLETKVDGDSVVVTTTPDAQRVIGDFIALMEGKPRTAGHSPSWAPAKK